MPAATPFLEALVNLPPALREVVDGYAEGYFLMADERSSALNWFEARTHTLLPLDERLHIPKSLKRVLNAGKFELKISQDVAGVIAGCRYRPSTWISDDLALLYQQLADHGIVHSYEAWQGDMLAGGVLGFWLGGAFIGESMFTAIEDGGKVALVHLCRYLAAQGFLLFDVQLTNPHLARFGSYEVPVEAYQGMLKAAVLMPCKM